MFYLFGHDATQETPPTVIHSNETQSIRLGNSCASYWQLNYSTVTARHIGKTASPCL